MNTLSRKILRIGAAKSRLFATLLLLVGAVPVSSYACPDWRNGNGASFHASSYAFDRGVSSGVVAGGSENLSYCPNVPGVGFVASVADFTTNITPSSGEALVFEAAGDCDVVLLVNTANRNWFFDDDDGHRHGSDARIVLTRPSVGTYDIWVGTYSSEMCDAAVGVWTTPVNSARNVSYNR